MKLTRTDYDSSYFDGPFYGARPDSLRNRERLGEILRHKDEGRLLEIGCGKGAFLQLASAHFDVEGIDVSPHAVAASSEYLKDRVSQADVQTDPLPERRYDVVAAFNVLEHLARPAQAVEGIARSLRPTGILMGSVPLNAGVMGRINTVLSNFFDRTHLSTPPPEVWRDYFIQAEFADVRFFGEILAGPHRSRYLRGPEWRYLGFNLMFLCQLPDR